MSQTFGEEIANSITHGVAALLVLASLPVVAVAAHNRGDAWTVFGVSVFCISIFLMFLMSTLYHAMEHNSRHKKVFKILDHIFIYVAIAGSYTPIAIQVIGGWKAVLILSIQWTMVLFGILYKSLARQSMPKTSMMIYLVMGWTVVLVIPQFLKNSTPAVFWLILAGGIAYSVGTIFYAMKSVKYHHMLWHLFVFIGAGTHYVGICFFMK